MAKFTLDHVAGIEQSMGYMRLPKGSLSDTPFKISDFDLLDDESYDVIKPRIYDSEWDCYVDEGVSHLVGAKDMTLASRLSVSKGGTGHDNYLKGITVWLTVEAPHYWWNQAQRYHWFDIVSSSSKMHTLTTSPISSKCTRYVSKNTIYMIDILITVYNEWDEHDHAFRTGVCESEDLMYCPTDKNEWFEMILDNLPMGYQLTAGVVTNYLQLKTMYRQRKNHALSHWNSDFDAFIKDLPLQQLITGDK